jgi:uncharacterized membrane protein
MKRPFPSAAARARSIRSDGRSRRVAPAAAAWQGTAVTARACPRSAQPGRTAARWLLAVCYAVAGYLHLHSPGAFLPIVPDWVPLPRATVLATGGCELAGALGLLIPRVRRAAAIGLALYAVCVFPANIKHAQPVIVWWALWAGEVIDWPFRRRS